MFKSALLSQSQPCIRLRAMKATSPKASIAPEDPIGMRLLVIVLLVMAAAGCGAVPAALPTAVPTDTPAAVGNPPLAHDFVSGQVLLPRGAYLFLEATVSDDGAGECSFPPAGQRPAPVYWLESGSLVIVWSALDVGPMPGGYDRLSVLERAVESVGFFAQHYLQGYSVGGGERAAMSTIRKLPASGYLSLVAADIQVVVEAVYENGAAVVNIQDQPYRLAPGAIWRETQHYEPQTGCHVTREIALINHGLVFQSGLRFTDR